MTDTPHHHDHNHAHHHSGCGGHHHSSGKKLTWSVFFNLIITAAEIVGGIMSGSLALLSDAMHNLSDALSLALAWGAQKIGNRNATMQSSFGYKRIEVLAAFVNLLTLVLIALFIIYESIERALDPQPVESTLMLVVAVIGLLANLATAGLLYKDAKTSLNIRGAFLHIIADAVSSVGVVVGGLIIMFYDFYLIDPILSMVIAVYMIYHSYSHLRETIDILMERTPAHINPEAVKSVALSFNPIENIHHLHIWQIDENQTALEAHVIIAKSALLNLDMIKSELKSKLKDEFDISHMTLEFESVCSDPAGGCFEANFESGLEKAA